jgi:pimeloyl-ACP methyl ester carboxylesterase
MKNNLSKNFCEHVSKPIFLFPLVLFLLFSTATVTHAKTVEGFAEVSGTKLYYEISGKGKTITLIHGGLVDRRMWDDQFKSLSKHFRVIRYDLRGFRKSAFPIGSYSNVEDLYALLRFLKVEKSSLVGLSLGGAIASDFTLEHPEMVESLVLVSSSLRGFQSSRNEKTIAVNKTAEEQGVKPAIELWLDHPFFATGKNNPTYQKRMRRMLKDNYRYWGPWKPEMQSIKVEWTAPPTIERLSVIKAPTIIVVGEKDASNILAIGGTLSDKIPGAKKIVIPSVSHHLNMEKPEEFNRIVLDFLNR